MKGISYITDSKNRKKSVVIDLKTIQRKPQKVHELIDVLIAESRRGDEVISWEDAKKQLRQRGKLWAIKSTRTISFLLPTILFLHHKLIRNHHTRINQLIIPEKVRSPHYIFKNQ